MMDDKTAANAVDQFTELAKCLTVRELKILVSIAKEYERACKKHPAWPSDKIHAAAIVQEECGELIRASLQQVYEDGSYNELRKEAIQTGAMCLRFISHLSEY